MPRLASRQLTSPHRLKRRYVFPTGAYYFGPWSDNKMHGDGGCFVDAKGRKYPPLPTSTCPHLTCFHCSWTGVFHNGSGPGLTTL